MEIVPRFEHLGVVREGFLEAHTFEDRVLRSSRLPSSRLSHREKESLAHSLQVAQQRAQELGQEMEKLQAAQAELQRQRARLEEEQDDTVQEVARARRELERR